MSKMKNIFPIFWAFVALFDNLATAQNKCLTPNNENGICVALQQCPSFYNYVSSNPLSQSDQAFLKKSQCGYFLLTTYVCCPQSNSGSQTASQFNQSQFGQPPSFNQPSSQFNQPSNQFNQFNQPLFNQPSSQFNQPLSQFNQPSSAFNQQPSLFNPSINHQPSTSFNRPTSDLNQLSSLLNPSSSSSNRPSQFGQPSSTFNQPSAPSNQPTFHSNQSPQITSSSRFTESNLPAPGVCGSQITGDRIVGGMETALGEYPWLALIEYTKRGYQGQFFCGGSLINEKYVITAAHCIKSKSVIESGFKPTSVRLGEHDVRTDIDCVDDECADPVIDLPIADIIVHENYEPTSNLQNDDITLIRLRRRVEFTDYIRPICLPFGRHLKNQNLDRFPLFVSGFGKTEKGSKSDVKLKVEVDGFNWNRCNKLYRITGISLIQSQLCAGGKAGEDSCQGDSGGPLMGQDKLGSGQPYTYLAGVVSFGLSKCGTPDYPGVYTRVDQYLDWIVNHMSP
ncbi:serine protease easter-like isoform X2 [Contarinia nasturtii]|uniref:serine protease easter-like isoform X2 n=1 Tax=Contarinia nasturtii TaxID=265458 RepID=UPI0012D3BEC8|nr:serine protease easter-like isoform X2 [Contarinia nasturtii]